MSRNTIRHTACAGTSDSNSKPHKLELWTKVYNKGKGEAHLHRRAFLSHVSSVGGFRLFVCVCVSAAKRSWEVLVRECTCTVNSSMLQRINQHNHVKLHDRCSCFVLIFVSPPTIMRRHLVRQQTGICRAQHAEQGKA